MKRHISLIILFLAAACTSVSEDSQSEPEVLTIKEYHSLKNTDEVQDGNIELIPIQTSAGTFNVWTKNKIISEM
jgi:hypothetical protein